jgi:hypothetical protein
MLMRRMSICGAVRMLVMRPMMGRPPQRSSLNGRIAQDSSQELTPAAGLESSMREVPMVEGGQAEYSQEQQGDCNGDCDRTDTYPENGE